MQEARGESVSVGRFVLCGGILVARHCISVTTQKAETAV